ncbi:MAG: cellulose biosynthesis cyclic di-GMP-binding regulatory protein BcsB [Pseudomonadota bacterium]
MTYKTKHARLVAAVATLMASTTYSSATLAEGAKSLEPAVEMLRAIHRNPEISRSLRARNEALLTTGSIVRSRGKDRVLYHLPATVQGQRFAGETASKDWAVYIAQEQLRGDVTLRLAYQNAVSVMPEASHLAVEINGVMVGKRAIQSPGGADVVSFDVPSHILVPGYNAVRIVTRQRHRVDCSIDATHELWTDLDAARSGFVFEQGNSALNSLDSIAAIARNKAGQVKLRLLAGAERSTDQVGRTMLLAQHTAVYSDFDHPEVEVADSVGRGPGLDVFAGSLSDLHKLAPAYAKVVQQNKALQILSRDGDERVALILLTDAAAEGADMDAFKARLAQLFPQRPARGSAQGLAIIENQRSTKVSEGDRLPFASLGLQSQEFDGRLYRKSFSVNLPSDYLSADYDQAEINLAMGYAAGLGRDNKFIIRVNGVTVTGFALSKPSGHVYDNKMLRVPLSAFQPGANSVEFEAQLAKADDAGCAPQQQIANAKRFVLSGQSSIRFPRLAHLARLPDLSGTVSAAFPYVVGGKAQPTVIAVPNPGFGELSTAATFATGLAVKARKPLDFTLHYGEPTQETKNAIVISSYRHLPPKLSAGIKGIDQNAFRTAWMNTEVGTQFAGGAGIDGMTTAGVSKEAKPYRVRTATPSQPVVHPTAKPSAQRPQGDMLADWQPQEGVRKARQKDNDSLGFTAQVTGLVSSVLGVGEHEKVKTPLITNPDSDLLLSQSISPNHRDGVWTVVTGRSESALQGGMGLLAKPSVLSRIQGETVTINGVDKTVTSSITSQSYVQVRSFSLRNLHLIVAGWFSNNHFIYGMLMVLGLLLGGLVSSRLLRVVGVQNEKEEGRA